MEESIRTIREKLVKSIEKNGIHAKETIKLSLLLHQLININAKLRKHNLQI